MTEAEALKAVVLRWGHRPRDERLTTHIALTARALGASGMILADTEDKGMKRRIEEVVQNWGGSFYFEMGVPWRAIVQRWRSTNAVVVHLTAYGENIQTSDVIERIRKTQKPVLVIVGSQKVPPEFFSKDVSDFNVAVGNQPHSECSSVAVFLDRLFRGKGLSQKFENAVMRIVPKKHGKKVVREKKPKG